MSAEQVKETPEMNAKMDEEQSAEEPPKKVAKIEEQEAEENEDEEGIRVSNWLIEVMEWITRMEMVESKMSTSCLAFKRLCWPKLHGNVEPHFVEELIFDKERVEQSGNFRGIVHRGHDGPIVPIPQVEPPEYILGFQRFIIYFLDDRTTEFIQLIAPKINEVEFHILRDTVEDDDQNNAIRSLYAIFHNKITKFAFNGSSSIRDFHRLFPGFIDSNQINQISLSQNLPIQDVDFDILLGWLMRGRQNGEQKMLKIGRIEEVGNLVERIKTAFLIDTVRRNFLVNFKFDQPVEEFMEENENTGENLELYLNIELNVPGHCYLLIRCPKGEEDRWKKEGEKKLKGNDNDGMTLISVQVEEY